MCTLVTAFGVHSEYPLIVAANRDEFYTRESTPPERVGDYVAGRDLASGGTWLGVTRRGFFVGLTNQRTWQGSSAGARSRGSVVRAALEAGEASAVRQMLEGLQPSSLGGFNLLFGDSSSLFVAYSRPTEARVHIEGLDRGIHVLANDVLGSPHFPKAERAETRMHDLIGRPWAQLAPALEELLADRSLPGLDSVPPPPAGAFLNREMAHRLQALCIDTPFYGTVSASIVAVNEGGVRSHRFCDGHPRPGEFEDVTHLHALPATVPT